MFECFFFYRGVSALGELKAGPGSRRRRLVWLRGGTFVLVERSKASSLSFSTTDQLALLLGSCTQPVAASFSPYLNI